MKLTGLTSYDILVPSYHNWRWTRSTRNIFRMCSNIKRARFGHFKCDNKINIRMQTCLSYNLIYIDEHQIVYEI
jgi:hypothetical protein